MADASGKVRTVGRVIAVAMIVASLNGTSATPALARGADDVAREGELHPFLDQPTLAMQQLFTDERFPNIVVTLDGTVLATWGNQKVRVRRSEDGGATWGEEITVADPGFHGGGTTVDETSGDVLVFVEDHHPPAPLTVYRSRDHGQT